MLKRVLTNRGLARLFVLACLVTTYAAWAAPAFGASSFTTGFEGPTLDSHLTDVNAAMTLADSDPPQYTIDGTAHLTGSLEDYWTYKYIQTADTDFRNTDWTCTIKLHAADWSSAEVPSAYGFRFGIGDGTPSTYWSYSCVPCNSVFVNMNPQSYFLAGTTFTTDAVYTPFPPYMDADSRGDWTLTATKTGDTLTFQATRPATGWDNTDRNATIATIDLSTSAPWLDDTNTRIFFGGGAVAMLWDDMTVIVNGVSPYGTLAGTVTLSDYNAKATNNGVLSPVLVEAKQNGIVIKSQLISAPDSEGLYHYSIEHVPNGAYDVVFSAARMLPKVTSNVVINSAQTTTCSGSIMNGDVDGDGSITTTDLSTVIKNLD